MYRVTPRLILLAMVTLVWSSPVARGDNAGASLVPPDARPARRLYNPEWGGVLGCVGIMVRVGWQRSRRRVLAKPKFLKFGV
jgi:hypothetical protein